MSTRLEQRGACEATEQRGRPSACAEPPCGWEARSRVQSNAMPKSHGREGGGQGGVIFLNKFLKRNQCGKQFSSFTQFLEPLSSGGWRLLLSLVSRALQALEIANTSSCPWFVHLFGKLGLFNTSSILPIGIFLVSSPSHLTMTSHFPFLATSYFLDCQQAVLQTGRRTSARCHSEEGAFGMILPPIRRHSLSSAQPACPGHCCVPGPEQGVSVTQRPHEEGAASCSHKAACGLCPWGLSCQRACTSC